MCDMILSSLSQISIVAIINMNVHPMAKAVQNPLRAMPPVIEADIIKNSISPPISQDLQR